MFTQMPNFAEGGFGDAPKFSNYLQRLIKVAPHFCSSGLRISSQKGFDQQLVDSFHQAQVPVDTALGSFGKTAQNRGLLYVGVFDQFIKPRKARSPSHVQMKLNFYLS